MYWQVLYPFFYPWFQELSLQENHFFTEILLAS